MTTTPSPEHELSVAGAWDRRFSADAYVYGEEPNDFLRQEGRRFQGKKILCLGEGEGRNAVFLARQGFAVTAVDASRVGLEKAQRLAARWGVTITTVVADLADFVIEPQAWDGIVSIFCHLPQPLRSLVQRRSVAGLAPGGMLLIEAYTPRQLDYRTGGPPQPELLIEPEELQRDLAGLRLLRCTEAVRDIHEGILHNGPSATVQLIATKPAAEQTAG